MIEYQALLDTNILIDMVNGVQQAYVALLPYRAFSISRIAWIELLTGLQPGQRTTVKRLLQNVIILDISEAIATRTVQLRQTTKLKLADAIIYATALEHGLTLLTRNTRDFSTGDVANSRTVQTLSCALVLERLSASGLTRPSVHSTHEGRWLPHPSAD